MASKFGLAGGIPERRVRPIWDAVDWRQYKAALKLSTALLQKYPKSPYALQSTDRLSPFLGRWEGRSVTKRSGVYGATIAEADIVVLLEIDADGKLTQDINSTSKGSTATSNVHWTGSRTDNLVTFDGGYDMTLLPGGIYMGCPSDVSKNVAESQSFHLELCWLESPDRRQRLVRTYDWHGLAVSSTYFYEVKVLEE